MNASLGCVVEGHGDVVAVPLLVQRIGLALNPPVYAEVTRPVRTPRDKLKKDGELERAVRLASAKAGAGAAVLVLVDADDDCPAELGPALLTRAVAELGNQPVGVVLAKFEYENWFLASVTSLTGQRGLETPLAPPNNPEGIRGAKEWLGDRMIGSRRYSETLDQPALTALFSMDEAGATDSFSKCVREITRLVQESAALIAGA